MLDSTVVFSELLYHPTSNGSDEWIELHNLMAVDMDLSAWVIDGIDYQFPTGTIVNAGDRILVAKSPATFADTIPASRLFGPFPGQLANQGERLRLINNSGRVMDELDYQDVAPWPIGADGSGATLSKRVADGGTAGPDNWSASRQLGGTPGTENFPRLNPAPRSPMLRLSEIAGNADAEFFVELMNSGGDPEQFAGYVLVSSNPERAAYAFPQGLLPANAYRVVTAQDLGYRPVDGERLFLVHTDETLVDAARVGTLARARQVPAGRDHSDPHTDAWLAVAQATPGSANAIMLETDIVINEIMYHAPGQSATPDQPATFDVTPLFDLDDGTLWRYRANATGLTEDWHQQAHAIGSDDWRQGAAPIGYERNALPIDLETTLANPATVFPPVRTYYFEREFDISLDAASDAELLLRHYLDDGAVFYLNGVEVARVNMPAGPVSSTTLALESAEAVPSDVIILPSESLVAGTNRLSVEVHQDSVASNDIVFSAALYLGTEATPFVPGQPYRESQEEWIELLNRSSSRTIDLSGWRLSDAIDFTFPAGTQLGPGQFVVVASQPEMLRDLHGGLANVLGPFEGQLSNRSETIQLLDAVGNPADEVTYFDSGTWPIDADGGGASLELRDPWADNRRAETWAAALPAELPEWQTIRYRGTVGPDGFTNGVTTRYHELILGLLDAGVVLIDDVSVIEDPQGSAIERVQNGNFTTDVLDESPATWRIAGTHHGRVVADPWDAGNQVLELRVTGAMEDRLNHASTTFADSARIREGVEYEISLRALSLSGSNQLRTHLYFDRLPVTSILPRSPRMGTPGVANALRIDNLGPTYTHLKHEPAVPDPDQPVTVSVTAADPQGVAALTLVYKVNEGEYQSVVMESAGDGRFHAVIPGQAASAIVQFYVEGQDQTGAVTYFPAEGAESRALYKVQDNRASSRGLHNLRIIMTPNDTRWLHTPINQLSNDRLGATVIYNESQVFYDVGVRLKGSNAGRSSPTYLGFNVEFNPDQLFRGVHDSVAIDRSGRSSSTPNTQDEILIKHIGLQAGNIPSMYDDLVHVIAPDPRHSRTALLMMARYGDVFLDSQFDNGSEGTVFRMDIAYVPNSTQGRDPEGFKIPSPYSHPLPTRDLQNLGDDKELYRSHLLIRNNRAEDDYRAIISAAQALDLTGNQQLEAAERVIDVDQWARVFALQSLTGAADVYTRGDLHHNIDFYVRPSDQRVLAFPWDWDFAFTASSSQPLIGTSGTAGRLMTQPAVRRLYYGHLYDIIERTFNNEYLDRWIDHYGQVAGQNLGSIKTYVRARRAFVLSRLPDEIPFAISTNAGEPIEVSTPNITLAGQGWVNVRQIRLAGSSEDLPVRWLSENDWQLEAPVKPGTNELTLHAYDHQDRIVGTASIQVTSSAQNDLAGQLRLTEIHYHPADPSAAELAVDSALDDNDFEFLELFNAGDHPLDLDHLRFTAGIDLTLQDVSLDPGAVGVLVRNEAAFRLRYGSAPAVLGEYDGSSLSNGGEQLTLVAPDGTVLFDFAYSDRDPWSPLADGQGPSLERVNPQSPTPSDPALPTSWRASPTVGGSPGSVQVDTLPGDLNNDGQLNALDLDLLCFAIRTQSEPVDLNDDGATDLNDLTHLVEVLMGSSIGDANLDGRFDSRDLVQLFQRGHYHDDVAMNSGWEDGDWNCDGEFTSADLVFALQRGSYEG